MGNTDLLIFKEMYSFSNVANFVCNFIIFLNPEARTTEPCQPDRTHRAGAGMRARQVGEGLAEAPRGPPPPPARPRPVPPRMWASSLPSVPSGVTGSTRADALPARTALPGVSAQTQPCV